MQGYYFLIVPAVPRKCRGFNIGGPYPSDIFCRVGGWLREGSLPSAFSPVGAACLSVLYRCANKKKQTMRKGPLFGAGQCAALSSFMEGNAIFVGNGMFCTNFTNEGEHWPSG